MWNLRNKNTNISLDQTIFNSNFFRAFNCCGIWILRLHWPWQRWWQARCILSLLPLWLLSCLWHVWTRIINRSSKMWLESSRLIKICKPWYMRKRYQPMCDVCIQVNIYCSWDVFNTIFSLGVFLTIFSVILVDAIQTLHLGMNNVLAIRCLILKLNVN